MLRITARSDAAGRTSLRLEGRVVGPWVRELELHCDAALRSGGGVILEMEGVSYLDADGVRLAGALIRKQVRLVGCSQFVAEQLEKGCHADSATV